ncbi:MAG TPA: AAA family ATPase, partial [Terriglobales bacterium]|nr:AAA family ATPase [Terriglobales bacterium]
KEALACLGYGIKNKKGFILLTGEVGTGKTTLLNRILEWLKLQRIATAFMFNPRLSVTQFFDFMMTDFGITCESMEKSRVLVRLNQWLLDRYRRGEGAVLIIDEAQNLSNELLEEIRLLTNLETSTEKLLQIILSGQPELEHKLKQPELRQLKQRITLRCRTYPLTLEETGEYMTQRLRLAGSNGTAVFTPEAVEAIYKFAQGVPRVTNLLCEHSLISAFVDQKKPVEATTVEEVAREFELDDLPRGMTPGMGGENLSMMEAVKIISGLQRNRKAEEKTAVPKETER